MTVAYTLSKKKDEDVATYSFTTVGQTISVVDLMKAFDADGLDGEKDAKTGKGFSLYKFSF